IDRGQVERGEAADLAHVDGEVEAVARNSLDECAERCGVRRAIDDLVQLLVLKAVDDAKEFVRRSRRRERTHPVLIREALREAWETGPGVARFQPNKPPTKKRRDSSARTAGGGGRCKIPGEPKELGERDSATHARQIDGPHIAQRNAREKRVDRYSIPTTKRTSPEISSFDT